MPTLSEESALLNTQAELYDEQSVAYPRISVTSDVTTDAHSGTGNKGNKKVPSSKITIASDSLLVNKDKQADGKPLPVSELAEPSPTTSTYIHHDEFIQQTKYEMAFPWRTIGTYMDDKTSIITDSDLKLSSKTAELISRYIYEKYYADLYWNTSLVVTCCLFTYGLTYIGYGIFGFIFISICTFAAYRAEFRRFHTSIRDDMQRIQSYEGLENKLESINWLNNFLAKFWVIYMPALSDLVISNTNQVLLEVSPPPPIDKLTLDEFTLGTKAPKIESIKSFTKLGKNVYQMDWNLNFTPNDVSDMTQNELKNKVDPKIALGIRIGKGFVGASLPVLVENMSFVGNLRIKIVLGDLFPHIDIVSICFLEPPKIDYALKPVGGNTLGIDIMSVIPGLSFFVNSLINSNLAPLMYYPNTIDVNPIDFIQKPSAIGCLAVKIRGAEYPSSTNINPYVKYGIENDFNAQYKTDIKNQTVIPIFNENKFILINDINARLKFELCELKATGKSDSLCEALFELQDLLQDPVIEFNESKLIKQNRNKGKIVYDLKWHPVIRPETLNDGTIINQFDSEIGIVNLNILSAMNLDFTTSLIGKLSTYLEIYLDNRLIEKSRIVKGNNDPDYHFQFENLIFNRSTAIVKIVIKDISSFKETTVATYESKLVDFLYLETDDRSHDTKAQKKNISHIIKDFTEGQGKLKFSTEWKPLGPITENEDDSSEISFVPPIGIFKININQCRNLMRMEQLGKIISFIAISTHNKVKGITTTVKENKSPVYDEEFYISIYSENQKITLECYNTDQRGNNEKLIGQTVIAVKNLLKDENVNKLLKFNNQIQKKGKNTGEIDYSLIYYPLMKLFSHQEIIQINEKATDSNNVNNNLDELEEQAEFLEDYKKHPDDYEWVDVLDENGLNNMLDMNKNKIIMSLDDLLKYNSGVLGINIIGGDISAKNAYVEFFIDDHSYPDFISRRSKSHRLLANSGDCFIRDLRNSILNIRISKTIDPKYKSDIIYQTVDSFNVIDLLKSGYDNPIDLILDDNKLSLVFEFVPTIDNSTNLFDTVENTGLLKVSVNSANNLLAADRGGKSDPYVIGYLNNRQVFKTNIVKKTVNPVWDETFSIPVKSKKKQKLILQLFDWDMTGDDDPLGNVTINLANLESNKPINDNFKVSIQGTINLELLFTAGYLKPNTSLLLSKEATTPFDKNLYLTNQLAGDAIGLAGYAAGNLADSAVGMANGAVGMANGAVGVANGAVGVANGAVRMAGGAAGIPSVAAGGFMKRMISHKNDESSSSSSNGGGGGSSGHFSFKPPGFGHKKKSSVDTASTHGGDVSQISNRNSSDLTSIKTNSFNGTAAIPGRLTLVEFKTEGDINDNLSIKIGLKSVNGSLKSVYKTNKYKVDKSEEVKIGESFAFKCDATASMVFSLRSVHHFGKTEELGTGMVVLQDVCGNKEDLQIPITGKVRGNLIVNFNYA